MSFFRFLFGRRGKRRAKIPARGNNFYITDVSGLLSGNARNGNNFIPHPRDHAAALKRLADFVAREKLDMACVFVGRQLREVSEGGEYRGIKAYYVERPDMLAQKLCDIAREMSRRSDITVITSDKAAERMLQDAGVSFMKCETLRKVLEEKAPQPARRKADPELPQQQPPEVEERDSDRDDSGGNNDLLKMIDPL